MSPRNSEEGDPAMSRASVLVVTGLVLVAGSAAGLSMVVASPSATARQAAPEAQELVNPIPATAESVAVGKRYYRSFCDDCHGPTGRGDGGMAMAGDTPSDFTDDVWDHGSTDGEIFVVIRDGTSSPDMEGYARKLDEDRIWHVVNFLKSLSKR